MTEEEERVIQFLYSNRTVEQTLETILTDVKMSGTLVESALRALHKCGLVFRRPGLKPGAESYATGCGYPLSEYGTVYSLTDTGEKLAEENCTRSYNTHRPSEHTGGRR